MIGAGEIVNRPKGSLRNVAVRRTTDTNPDEGNEPALYISGRVWADTNGDGVQDAALSGVTVSLIDMYGNKVDEVTSDDFGLFEFFNVTPGTYQLIQTNLPGYTEVSDSQGDPLDSTITVELDVGGASSYDNDFVDAPPRNVDVPTNPPNVPAYISGRVWSDTDGDGVGDEVLPGVIVYLQDEFGNNIQTEATDDQGAYEFFNVAPAKYQVVQNNLEGYTEVYDTQGDPTDNSILVDVSDGQPSYNNDFVDAPPKGPAPTPSPVVQGPQPGTVAGKVFFRLPGGAPADDQPLPGVVVTLHYADGSTFFDVGTDENGYYEFIQVPDGKYTIVQTNLEGYTWLSDTDGSAVDGTIGVEIANGSYTMNNNFVDSPPAELVADLRVTGAPGADLYVSGRVWSDVNHNSVDEVELPGVLITLNNENGDTVDQDTTDDQGLFEFFNVAPGKYTILQTNLDGYTDVADTDGDPLDSVIKLDLTDGSDSYDNDFVDAPPLDMVQPTDPPGTPTYISGRVWSDTDGDGVGDEVLPGVIVYLEDPDGNTIMTKSTDEQGLYEFDQVALGKYQITQTGLPGYTDVSDTQGDPLDSLIFVDVTDGVASYGNNFVDAPPPDDTSSGTISGTVSVRAPGDELDLQPLIGVVVSLANSTGDIIIDAGTDENGYYAFTDLKFGQYSIIQTNLDGYSDVSDSSGDRLDGKIQVELKKGAESSYGNNFIDAPPATVNVDENQEVMLTVSNISGKVLGDMDGDGIGDHGLKGVEMALLDWNNDTVYLTNTDKAGEYGFSVRIPNGKYHIIASPRVDFVDVSDTQGDPLDNTIYFDYVEGQGFINNNFLDAPSASYRRNRFSGAVNGGSGSIAGLTIAAVVVVIVGIVCYRRRRATYGYPYPGTEGTHLRSFDFS
jgi:uncharacterized surface anchored protein